MDLDGVDVLDLYKSFLVLMTTHSYSASMGSTFYARGNSGFSILAWDT